MASEWAGGVKIAPGTYGDAPILDPARAVLLRFLPARADDAAFLTVVDEALRSSRGRKIAEEGSTHIGELSAIRNIITDRGLPSVFVGIPMWESYLDTEAVSRSCAAGAWQLMPETAIEMGLAVQDCHIGGSIWSPQPGTVSSPSSPYRLPSGFCGISACDVDDRLDLTRSTIAAIDFLDRMYAAPDITRNPDRSALTVLAYHSGLGTVRGLVNTQYDPLADIDTCAKGDCAHFGKVGAGYVPGVIASAALSVCGASTVEASPFDSESKTSMCRSLGHAGLLPGSDEAVAAAEDR